MGEEHEHVITYTFKPYQQISKCDCIHDFDIVTNIEGLR